MSKSFRQINRRTVLRGLGVAMGLPMLDAMRPIGAIGGATATKPPVRMAFLFFPNGVNPKTWTPSAVGKEFELGPMLPRGRSVSLDARVVV